MNDKIQIKGGCLSNETLTSMTGRIIATTITLLRRISNLESKLSCFFTKLICFKLLTQQSWIRALDNKFSLLKVQKIYYKALMFLMLATTAYSATYYINGASGNDGNPGTIGSPWQTIRKANITLVAGDTVYIRGGTSSFQVYSIGALDTAQEGIHPRNTGTDASHRITYATYQNEKVNFVGIDTLISQGIQIQDKNWIKVTGYDGSTSAMNFKFTNMVLNCWIWSATQYNGVGSHYNEISYCEFGQCNFAKVIYYTVFRGSTIYRMSQYNWIHHCSLHDYGFQTDAIDGSTLLEIGNEVIGNGLASTVDDWSARDNTGYNVVENCIFYHAGHHLIGVQGKYNIIRNNIFHNEQWYSADLNQYYGYRVFYMAGSWPINHGHNIVEGNRISHASGNMNPSNDGGTGIPIHQTYDIVRYNDFYANSRRPINLTFKYVPGGDSEMADSNSIYNNTFMSNGFCASYDLPHADKWDAIPITFFLTKTTDFERMKDNVVKNNLFWKNSNTVNGAPTFSTYLASHGFNECSPNPCGNTILEPNWLETQGNPKFTSEGSYGSPSIGTTKEWYWGANNPDGSDITTHNTEPNFNLQSSSPVIDQGTYLTQTNGSGSNSIVLIVDDAKYFQPGYGNGAGGGAVVYADWIAIGTVSKTVQIISINYDSNTITLASPMTWSNGAPVWLYKKSDGQVVLSGTAPDYGAHEYAPSAVQAISLSPGWNWISFNILLGDISLSSVFSSILTQVEQVKTQTQSALRSNGAWKGDLADMNGIEQYKMYKVKVSAACMLTVTGTAVLSATPISLAGGWNWVAYLPTTAMPIATALASINGQVQEVKSLTQSATYSGGAWTGALQQLNPGQGYAIKMNAAGTLTYPAGK